MATACIAPDEISEEALLAYVRGESTAETAAHLSRCARCRREVEVYQRLQQVLRDRLYRFDCPDAEQLEAFVSATLAKADAKRIAVHLSRCPLCRQEVEALMSHAVQAERITAVVTRPLADERFPYRSGRRRGTTMCISQPDGIDIYLVPFGKGRLLGKVTRAGTALTAWAGGRVQLFQGFEPGPTATIDHRGGFRLEGLTPDVRYALKISVPGEEARDVRIIADIVV
ncbi:MAG TPA: hypothetical protein EYH31_10450 [Anaerolineae bacterium]|nr:hypothetical protein [Anaerolineae bacterium]